MLLQLDLPRNQATLHELAGVHDRSYWALSANPRIYRIEEAVQDLDEDWWTTKGHEIAPGDRVVIWRTLGDDGHRGVVGLGEVLTGPEERVVQNPYWISTPDQGPRIRVSYRTLPSLPHWIDQHPGGAAASLSVARARGGSVFRIQPDQWNRLMEELGGWQEASPEVEEHRAWRPGRDQGRGPSAAARKAIELRAMDLAKEHYGRSWPQIMDVSASASYDLHCRRSDEELHVEVKGTTGLGESILVTPNEVTLARHRRPATSLFVVSAIQVQEMEGEAQATGGEVRVFEPWDPDDFDLNPTGYECRLSARGGPGEPEGTLPVPSPNQVPS